ncbi:MAG: sulfatase-like hydrolase/transferase, partial [Marinoscillum sp.]
NTPYRRFKKWNHEGGIKTPLIVNWPGVIEPGRVTSAVGHIMDFMPTFSELANASFPDNIDGSPLNSIDGKSLLPIFTDTAGTQHNALFWQSNPREHRAVRQGDWKLVSQGDDFETELYNLATDPSENTDLAVIMPEKVAELDSLFYHWASQMNIEDQEYIEY